MPQRREKGSGSVYLDPANPKRWIGEIRINGKRRRVSARSKTEVRAKLKALAVKAEVGVLGDRQVTVRAIAETFMKREVPNLSHNGRPLAPSTLETYEWAMAIIGDELGSVKLHRLTVANVEAMLDLLADRGMSKASLIKIRSKLSQVIAFAERRGQVHRNVARLAQLPPQAAPTRTRNALMPDDARRLLTALRNARNGAMYGLSLLLGLRPGEAAGLYWEDLDLDSATPTVNVTRGVSLENGGASISDELKTATSKRTIELTADLAAWLKAHRRDQIEERTVAIRWLDDRLVFATPTGHVTDPSRNRKDLVAICERARVQKTLPNELRHSCASLLADEGVPNEAIADLLGHATTRMVDSTYRHRLRPVVSVAARAAWSDAK